MHPGSSCTRAPRSYEVDACARPVHNTAPGLLPFSASGQTPANRAAGNNIMGNRAMFFGGHVNVFQPSVRGQSGCRRACAVHRYHESLPQHLCQVYSVTDHPIRLLGPEVDIRRLGPVHPDLYIRESRIGLMIWRPAVSRRPEICHLRQHLATLLWVLA
jgi:hypothetical protein